jgi:hypothetical protein
MRGRTRVSGTVTAGIWVLRLSVLVVWYQFQHLG